MALPPGFVLDNVPAAPPTPTAQRTNRVIAPADPYKQGAEERAREDQAYERILKGLQIDRLTREAEDPTIGLSPAQKAVDTKYASEYIDWVQGGRADAAKSREQLGEALNTLRGSDSLTGPFIGRAPDLVNEIFNPKAIPTKESVEEIVQRNLRLILGAQFTKEEGERLIARAYNMRQPEAENEKRVRRLLGQIASAAEAKESAAQYYEQNGTLVGWTGSLPTIEDFENALDDEGADQGFTPPVSSNQPIPGVREPTTRDEFRDGIQWDIDKPEGSFDAERDRYLSSLGIDASGEQKIMGFWNANSGNPDLTVEGAREWYNRNGYPLPTDEALATSVAEARRGMQFGGFNTSQQEKAYNERLDALIAKRGRDPESMSGSIGIGATQGVLLGGADELAGVGGFLGNAFSGNPSAAYGVERDAIRREQERAQEANPMTTGLSEFGGSMLTGGLGMRGAARAGGLAAQAARMGNTERAASLGRLAVRASVKPGGALGAAYGFNTGEGLGGSVGNAAIGGATGAALSMGGTKLGTAIGSRLGQSTGRAAAVTNDEANALTRETGVPIFTSDALPPKTFMGTIAQATGERIPFAGTGGKRAAQQEARTEAVKNVLGEYNALSGVAAIDDVMTDLADQRSAALTRFSNAKKTVKNQLSGEVPVNRALKAIETQTARLERIGTDAARQVIAKLDNWKAALQNKDIDAIESIRKEMGEAFKAPELTAARGEGEKAINALYDPLRSDITEFVEKTAGPAAAKQWREANANLSRLSGEVKMGTLRRVLQSGDTTPEDVGKLLFSAKPSEIRALYDGLSDKGKAAARTTILQRAFEKAGNDVDELSPDKFLRELNRMSKPMGVFFEGADGNRVKGLVRALGLTRRASVASAAPPTGAQNWPILASLGLGSFFDLGTTVGIGTTVGAAARAYESKAVRAALLKLARSKPNSPDETTAMTQLQGAISRLPAANDNAGFAAQAFNASPGNLAASDNENNRGGVPPQ